MANTITTTKRHYTRRSVDFREGSYKCLPDNGKQFMRDECAAWVSNCSKTSAQDLPETRWWLKAQRPGSTHQQETRL